MQFRRSNTFRSMLALLMAFIIMLPAFPAVFGEASLTDVEYGVVENTQQEEISTSDADQTSAEFEDEESQEDVDAEEEDSLEENTSQTSAELEDEESQEDVDAEEEDSLEENTSQTSAELEDEESQEDVDAEEEDSLEENTSQTSAELEDEESQEDVDAEEEDSLEENTSQTSAELEDEESQEDVDAEQENSLTEDSSQPPIVLVEEVVEEAPTLVVAPSQPPTVLADGDYEIAVTALRADNDTVSSANNDLVNPARLEVKGGKITAFVTMGRSNMMTNFSIQNNAGDFELAEVYAENAAEHKKIYKLEVEDIDRPIMARVTIGPPANMTVQFRLVFDKDTLSAVAPDPGQNPGPTPPVFVDGEYDIAVTALQETSNSLSMADGNLVKPAKLEVTNGKITAFITMKNTDQMTNFSLKNSVGEFKAVEIYAENAAENKKTYKIEVEDIGMPIMVQTYIPAANLTVRFRLVFDTDVLPETPGITPEPEPGPQNPGGPLDPTKLEDGEYDIAVTALQETNDSLSMADGNLVKPAKLEVTNGKITAFITMKNTHQMTNFSVKNSVGEFKAVEIYAEDAAENKKTYKIEIEDIGMPIMAQTYIPAANLTVRFRLVFDTDALPETPGITPEPGSQNPGGPIDPTKLEDGEYRINVSAIQETSNSPSLAGNSLHKTAYLKVQDGRIYAFITIGDGDGLRDFKVRNSSGNFQLAEIYAENGQAKTKTYKFEVQDLNTPVMVEVYVSAMGFAPKFRIVFNTATLARDHVPSPQFTTVQTNFSVTGNTVKFNVTPSLAPNSSKAVATVASDVLERAFDQIRNNMETKIAQIVVEKVQRATAYEIVIPASYLSSDTANRKIEIQTDLGWILLPENLLDASKGTNSGDAVVTIQMADKSKLDNTMKEAIGNKPIIEITLKVRGNTVAWSNAATAVSISVPYKPTTEELEGEEGIIVWYIDGHFGDIMWANGLYDSETEVVTFTTLTESDTITSTTKIMITPVLEENATKAIATISLEMLEAAFSQFEEEDEGQKIVEIEIEEMEEVDAYEISLPANYLSLFSKHHKIEVQTYLGNILLSGNMLDYLGDLDAEEVTLSIQTADKSNLPQATLMAIGNRPVLEINLKINHQTIPWRNAAAPVRISIPYSPTAEELKNSEHMAVWYINALGNGIAVPSGRYDAASDRVIFTTTHFSKYAVVKSQRSFDDIQGMVWARNPIEVLAAKGIISGTSNNTFTPESSISRADYTIMLAKTLELTAEAEENFQDVKKADYFYKHVGIAKNLGITGEISREFHPNTAISRQDMAVFTQNALKKANRIKTTEAYNTTITFIEEYLLTNEGRYVDPNQSMTRAETAVFLYELYNRVYPVANNIKTPISSELEDEGYAIDVTALHEVNDSPSMADGNLIKPAKIILKDGKMTAFITMKNTDQMANFSVQNSAGEFKSAEVYAEDAVDNKKTYKVEILDLDKPVMVQTYIAAANLTVRFRLVFDKDIL